jgi:hypothetical protein
VAPGNLSVRGNWSLQAGTWLAYFGRALSRVLLHGALGIQERGLPCGEALKRGLTDWLMRKAFALQTAAFKPCAFGKTGSML